MLPLLQVYMKKFGRMVKGCVLRTAGEMQFRIHCTYKKICHPLDRFEVECVIGRDIKQSDFGGIVRVLSNWCDTCDTMLSCIETQADITAVFISRNVPDIRIISRY